MYDVISAGGKVRDVSALSGDSHCAVAMWFLPGAGAAGPPAVESTAKTEGDGTMTAYVEVDWCDSKLETWDSRRSAEHGSVWLS